MATAGLSVSRARVLVLAFASFLYCASFTFPRQADASCARAHILGRGHGRPVERTHLRLTQAEFNAGLARLHFTKS